MPNSISANDKNRFGPPGSSLAGLPSWSTNNFESRRPSVLEERNGIEVIKWEQHIEEENNPMPGARTARNTQNPENARFFLAKRILIVLFTGLALIWIVVYIGVNIGSPMKERNDNSTGNTEKELRGAGVSVVLHPNEYLDAGQFRHSPNGRFKVGLSKTDVNLVLMEAGDSGETVIWSTGVDFDSGSNSGIKPRCYMQADGNIVLRDVETRESIWMTKTHGNSKALLVVENSGIVAVRSGDGVNNVVWMEGIPREKYSGPSSEDMVFPIRGAFYYPWYPKTWHIDGHRAHYDTSLGMYSSSDPEVAEAHIAAMDFGNIGLSIASWWGPSTNLDRARLTMLMDETAAQKSPLRWTVYHENERDYDPTPEELREDFDYLKKWFAWHKTWAHIDGRPVIFVYNEKNGCGVATRWMLASRGEWYVVLKLFSGFEDCPDQPDSWHQYGAGKTDGTVHNPRHSFVLSPGFWRADRDVPDLERLDRTRFCENTKRMVESAEPWQLIVSFNEAGEGTLVEPSPDWESASGYGDYLDCLHENS